MLVLSRTKGQRLIVGVAEPVIFEVLEIRGDKVRIGISAAPHVSIQREEVWLKMNPGRTLPRAAVQVTPFVDANGREAAAEFQRGK